MQKRYDEIRGVGADVLVVTQAGVELLAAFVREEPLPFPIVADPARVAYRAFGLERTTWSTFLRFGVILRYLQLMLGGWLPRRPHKEEDILQLGGDFVLDAAGRLFYAHRSAEPTNRPGIENLLQVLRQAAGVLPNP